MTIFGKAIAATALAAMSVASVPAQARWHDHHGGHPHNDRIDGGDVLLGAVLAGGLFALLSSGKKHDSPPREEIAMEEDEPAQDARADPANRTLSIARTDQESAVEACVASAESEGRRFARVATIDRVTMVDAVASDWIVRGRIGLRDDYRAPSVDLRPFTCRVGDRGVEEVTIAGEPAPAG